jgi:hypothetical protein
MPTPARPKGMPVTMPDGFVIPDVPPGTTQDELWEMYMALQTPKTSIDKALAAHEADQALKQAQAQSGYEGRQAQIAAFDAANPQVQPWASPLVTEAPPAVHPQLEHIEKPLPSAPDANFWLSTRLGMLEDEETKRRVMARVLFPDDPNGIDRVGFLDGKPVYVDDNNQLQQLSSGPARFGAGMVANSPETLGSVAGSFFGPAGTAVGAALGHGLKRTIAGQIEGEPFDPAGIGTGMAIEGAVGGLGDLPGRGIRSIADRGTWVRDMTRKDLRNAQEVQRRIKDTTDIDVDIPQASGDRQLISMRNFLSRFPGRAAKVMQDKDERGLEQFHQRTSKVLDSIAKAKPAEIAEAGGANAARLALMAAKRNVSNKVRPIYERAYEKNPLITDPELLQFLKLPYFEQAYKAGQTIAKLEEREAPHIVATTVKETRKKHSSGKFYVTEREVQEAPITAPDLRSLDYLKQGLDTVIADLEKDGQITKLSGALRQQKKAFVDALDRLPDADYQAARAEYAKLYGEILRPLEQSPVGVLAKLKDQNAVGVAAQVFGDENVTASQIALAKRAVQAENPEAWNDLVRAWLGGVFARARTETVKGVESSPAGKVRQEVYGNEALREKMRAILPAGAVEDFDNLMFAAQKLSSTTLAGSNTAADTEMKEILKGRGLSTLKWFLTPRKKLLDTAEAEALHKGSYEMAVALTDPTKVKHIRRVLMMKPSTKQAILLSTIIGARTGVEAARSAYPNEEDTPGLVPAE